MREKVRWVVLILVSALGATGVFVAPASAQGTPSDDLQETSAPSAEGDAALAAVCSSNPPHPSFTTRAVTFTGTTACAQCLEHYNRYWAGGYDGYCWRTASIFAELWLRPRAPVNMESIPSSDGRETGFARTGDWLLPLCLMYDNNGREWVLVINRTGHAGIQHQNTAGFVPFNIRNWNKFLYTCEATKSLSIQISSVYPQVDMRGVAGPDTPWTGWARPGQELWAMCSLSGHDGFRWDLVINRQGIGGVQHQNTIGFVPYAKTSGVYWLPSCV